jgi:hypothetical protein
VVVIGAPAEAIRIAEKLLQTIANDLVFFLIAAGVQVTQAFDLRLEFRQLAGANLLTHFKMPDERLIQLLSNRLPLIGICGHLVLRR